MPEINEEVFDVRKIERMLNEGVITREQVDAYFASLEDCAANADTSTVQMVAHDRSRRRMVEDEGGPEEDEG